LLLLLLAGHVKDARLPHSYANVAKRHEGHSDAEGRHEFVSAHQYWMFAPLVHAWHVEADVLREMGREMVAGLPVGHAAGVESTSVDVEKHWPRGKTCAVAADATLPGHDVRDTPAEEHDAITLFTPVLLGVTRTPMVEVLR